MRNVLLGRRCGDDSGRGTSLHVLRISMSDGEEKRYDLNSSCNHGDGN
jgi:hypothetical protein